MGGFMMPPPAPEVQALLAKGGVESPELHSYAQEKGVPVLELHRQILRAPPRPSPRNGNTRRRNSRRFPEPNFKSASLTNSR